MTRDRLERLGKQELAEFASTVLTGDWDGDGLVALLFCDGKVRDEDDCIARITKEFKASRPDAYKLYGKLRRIEVAGAQGLPIGMFSSLLPLLVGFFLPRDDGSRLSLIVRCSQ